MSDDFFAKIDTVMDGRAEKAASEEIAAAAARPAVADIIAQSAELARDYAAKLGKRGITLTVEAGSNWISMKMRYQDGGHRDMSYGASNDLRRLEAMTNFTSDDGKTYNSTDGSGDPVEGWTIDRFKARIEKLIEEYVFYASRHRGVL